MPKQCIPKTVRDAVWDKYNGKIFEGKCFCCKTSLSPHNFECGHVISEKLGGKVSIDNLRPICSKCNRSMGTNDMNYFIEKYGFDKITEKEKESEHEDEHAKEEIDESDIEEEEDDEPEIDIFENNVQFTGSMSVIQISSLVNDYNTNKIDLNPIYQRDSVWNSDKQTNFINSLIKHIIPTPLIFNVNSDGKTICIDGKQRITAIVDFVDNKIPLIMDNNKIYYSKIHKGTDNTRIFTSDEKTKFDNIDIWISKYSNLSVSNEQEIFQRIQNGCELTYGEIIPSLIKDTKVCESFKKYCSANIKYIEKYLTFKLSRVKTRGEEYEIISTIFYMLCNSTTVIPSRKQLDQFLGVLSLDLINEHMDELKFVVNNIFEKVLTCDKIPQMNKIKLYVITYKLYDLLPEGKPLDCVKCIKIVNKTLEDCKTIKYSKTKKCYSAIEKNLVKNWKKFYK